MAATKTSKSGAKSKARTAAKKVAKPAAGRKAARPPKVVAKASKTVKSAKSKPGKPARVAKKAAPTPAKSKPARPPAKKLTGKPAAPAKPASTTPAANAPATSAAPPIAKAAPINGAETGKIAKMTSAPKEAASVSAKPAAAPAKPSRARPSPRASNGLLTEEQIRHAPESDYMNDDQLAFFRERLLQMRAEVLARELDVKERLHQREVFADPADRASAEEEHWLDLRLRERESLLLRKIEDALRRIRDREYGYCEKTGEPIGIARLLARPTATVCVDVKGQDERAESQYRDR